MFRVSPNHLLWVLDGLLDGEVHNRVTVPDEQKKWARIALDRMLSIHLVAEEIFMPHTLPALPYN